MQTGKLKKVKERLAPFYGLAIPLAYAIVLLGVSQFHDTFEEWDGVVQLFAGREIFEGIGYRGWISLSYPPLYPFLAGLISQFLPGFWAAKLVSHVSGVLLLWVAYELAVDATEDKRAGLLTQALLALNPLYFLTSLQAENHMLDSLVFVSSLLLLAKALSKPTLSRFFVTGLVAGLAGLTRYTSYVLPIILAIAPFAFMRPKQAIRRSAVVIAGFVAVSLPWWIANTLANGSPLASMRYLDLGVFVIEDNIQRWWWSTSASYHSAMDIVTAAPLRYLQNMARNVYSSARILVACSGALAPFVIPTIFDIPLSPKAKYWLTVLVGLALYTVLVSQAYVYNEVFLSWVIILGVLGVRFLRKYLGQLKGIYPLLGKRSLTISTVAILLAAGLLLTTLQIRAYVRADDYDNGQLADVRAVTKTLKEYDPNIEEKFIMSIHPARAYYLGANFLPPPLYYTGSLDGLVSCEGVNPQAKVSDLRFPSTTPAEEARADYLIYDVALRSYLPQFAFLFDPESDKIPEYFKVV